jgi:hypothetical protein
VEKDGEGSIYGFKCDLGVLGEGLKVLVEVMKKEINVSG